jgi:hypothetical protein
MSNLDQVLGGVLGAGAELSLDAVGALLDRSTAAAEVEIETVFGRAGWYGLDAQPFDQPTATLDDPPASKLPTIDAERRLWLARYNPADPAFDVPDIDDDFKFPWQRPEAAPREGWWLSTVNTPAGRAAIEEIATGDLVICQRTDPRAGNRAPDDDRHDDMLVGVCAIGMTDSWDDVDTGERERRACLVPLTKFTHPVPRRTARNNHRLRGPSFKAPRQLPGREGPLGFGLSAVDWADAIDLLSVCGIPPEALAEPDTACLAARLRASDTGNELFLRLRYDAVLRDRVRRVHERQAERRAETWAAAHGYVKRAEFQHVPLAGFDLLFADAVGTLLQVEVKGYSSRNLARVHLQPSQAWRALDAAAGVPPDWRLFALLGAGSKNPAEKVLEPARVVTLVGAGGLQVKGGWPAPRPRPRSSPP